MLFHLSLLVFSECEFEVDILYTKNIPKSRKKLSIYGLKPEIEVIGAIDIEKIEGIVINSTWHFYINYGIKV